MEYNLNDDDVIAKEESFLKRRSNGMMLSDEDINILKRSGINYLDYTNLSSLIFAIEETLNYEENEELEELNKKLGEYNYYNYTNK